MDTTWECVVVGGGAAGLSAALVLGRARRRTVVVDAGRQSNRVAHGINGLLGHDGRAPDEFYALARNELTKYPTVQVRTGEVVGAVRKDGGFVLTLADGTELTAARVLLAPGMDYRHPDVLGIAERWGRAVFHCPFCHGWEVREQTLGVLDDGATGVHRAMLLRMWSDDVTLFTNGPSSLDADQRAHLGSAGITVEERVVASLEGPDEELSNIRFDDGAVRRCDGLLVPVTLHQRSSLADQLGVSTAEPGPVSVDAIDVDAMYFTSTAGVSAAGDASSQMPSVTLAIAAGSTAAAMLISDYAMKSSAAVSERAGEWPSPGPDTSTEDFWEDFYLHGRGKWSGRPNKLLVDEATDLPAGTALDLGCGQGDDAIWLADRGWQVTGVDVANNALELAARRAESAGVTASVVWQQHDLASSFPDGSFDLVAASYLHSPVEMPRSEILRRAAAAVAPGGTLLVIGHATSPQGAHPHVEVHFPTPDEVLADLALPEGAWRVDRRADVARKTEDADGRPATHNDNVLRLTRLTD